MLLRWSWISIFVPRISVVMKENAGCYKLFLVDCRLTDLLAMFYSFLRTKFVIARAKKHCGRGRIREQSVSCFSQEQHSSNFLTLKKRPQFTASVVWSGTDAMLVVVILCDDLFFYPSSEYVRLWC